VAVFKFTKVSVFSLSVPRKNAKLTPESEDKNTRPAKNISKIKFVYF
jgi:hypothetical protein